MVCQQIKKTCEDWNHDTSDWISQPPITNLSWNAEMTIWGKVAHLQGWCSWVGDAAQICIRHKLGKYLPHLPFAVFPILKWNKTQGQDGNENPDGQNEWINAFFFKLPVLNKFVFHLATCICHNCWIVWLTIHRDVHFAVKVRHHFHHHVSIECMASSNKVEIQELKEAKPKKNGSTNLHQETLSSVPSYIVLWWMTKQDLFKLETLDMQPSRIALMVAGAATHWAVSSLSLQTWNGHKWLKFKNPSMK